MPLKYLLEPQRYYQTQDFQRAGYQLVYYYGLDPYYLRDIKPVQRFPLADIQRDFIFLLLLSDIVILSPSAIFGPLLQHKGLQHFLTPFWQDNSITTSIWPDYQDALPEFAAQQLRQHKPDQQQQQAACRLLYPQGEAKGLFVRNVRQQSQEYQLAFEKMYRQIFMAGRHQNPDNTNWSAAQDARHLRTQLTGYLARLQQRQQPGLNRAHLMQALTDPAFISDYPSFLTQRTLHLSFFLYGLMGAKASDCKIYPDIPEALKWHLPAHLAQHIAPELNWACFSRWLQAYQITEAELLQGLSGHHLQALRHQAHDLLLHFRYAFRRWVQLKLPRLALKSTAPTRAALSERLKFALADFCHQLSRPRFAATASHQQRALPPARLSATQALIWQYLQTYSEQPSRGEKLSEQLQLNISTVRQAIRQLRLKGVSITYARLPEGRGYQLAKCP